MADLTLSSTAATIAFAPVAPLVAVAKSSTASALVIAPVSASVEYPAGGSVHGGGIGLSLSLSLDL